MTTSPHTPLITEESKVNQTMVKGSIRRTILLSLLALALISWFILGLASIGLNVNNSAILIGLAILGTIPLAIFFSRYLAQPIIEMAQTAMAMANGDFKRRITISRHDELGLLGQALNLMSQHIEKLINQLEERVNERTQALAQANQQLQQQTIQLETSAQVSRVTASTLDLESLNKQIVEIIKTGFGFYHVSIYLIDDSGHWAVVSEATDTLGQTMKKGKYRLAIDDHSVVGWVSKNRHACLAYRDISSSEFRFLSFEQPGTQIAKIKSVPTNLLPETRSELALPLISNDRLIGVLDVHSTAEAAFHQDNVPILQTLADQLAAAIEKAQLYAQIVAERDRVNSRLTDIQSSLRETHLMLDISRLLSGAITLNDIYVALNQSVMTIGAERCILYLCDDLDQNNIPRRGEIVFVGDIDPTLSNEGIGQHFHLASYPVLAELVSTQETLVISDIETDKRLSVAEKEFLQKFDSYSILINPLVSRGHVIGLISIEYRTQHNFSERELALYRTICNQTTIAIENAQQIQRTEFALTETQTLYRAGRVLAGAADLQGILQEALIEFVYSFGLDQGGITLLTPDRKQGQLMAYVENGQLQAVDKLKFPISKDVPYQQILLSGQPFISVDAPNDPRLSEFHSFNAQEIIKSLLEAPMIIHGETIGWIGVDAVKTYRSFSQQEIDLARAMADQIAITIQNRRLLEQTERRANRLKAVAKVGESVSGMIDLNKIFNNTVDLIRDRFGFYHVSIFIIDEAREWAVVRASTGEVGKIMVERPHRLLIGSNSIVGHVTANAEPRIAMDVGEDAVHFQNPLLPHTRAEMALPLISRGLVIGALDVQSVEVDAFNEEDIETLQIMADQLAAAIENARLFEQTQRRLVEQATLYRIGTKIGATLDLQEATDSLVAETAEALNVAKCRLTLIEENNVGYIISDYIKSDSYFTNEQGHRFDLKQIPEFLTMIGTKQEFVIHIDDPQANGSAFEYLKAHQGTILAIVPVLLRNKVIAFLEVYDYTPNHRFSREDIWLLNSIALQAANAIENARLFQSAQDSQTFMKTIIDQIPDPIFIKDKNQKWVVVNHAFAEGLLGLPEEKVIGHTDHDYFPSEIADWLLAQDIKLFEAGQTQEAEGQISNAAGQTRAIYARKVPLLGDDGQPEYLIGIINDITERKRVEEALARRAAELEESRSFLDSIIENIPTVLFVKDARDLTFVQWNRAGEKLLGLDRNEMIGKSDYDFVPKEQADFFTAKDRETLSGGKLVDIPEEPIHTAHKGPRILHTRKVPVYGADGQAKYLLGISEDITERKQAEEALKRAFERSQSLYRISNALATTTDQQGMFETVLAEYLRLLNLKQGSLMLLDQVGQSSKLQTLYLDGKNVEPNFTLSLEEDPVTQYLLKNPAPLVIEDIQTHPLTKDDQRLRQQPQIKSALVIPLLIRGKVIGHIAASSPEIAYLFSESDIEIGQAIADQLAIWLENRQLLTEAQYRLNRLQTAAEVSRAASSILDVDELIENSVNLIRDQFDFYYVGLFLVDEAREWAVLRAGTGEAGRLQLQDNHRLEIGGESMIGWSIYHRQPRIALDVGQEAVRFKNKYLPNTHSEMALPLISRDKAIGALTVQSEERGAFSVEDITLLQTMADQLANAIENTRLFAQTQSALLETENLYRITQELLSASDEETVYRLAIEAIAQSGIDSSAIYMYAGSGGQETGNKEQVIEQKTTWAVHSALTFPTGTRFKAADLIIEQLVPRQGVLLIEDIDHDEHLTDPIRHALALMGLKSLMILPLATYQRRLGFLIVAYETSRRTFTRQQVRFYNTIAQQMVVALENLRLLDASQKRAQREEIIREITSKIRSATNIEDILKTTVTELSKVLGASRGGVTLDIDVPAVPEAQITNEPRSYATHNDPTGANKAQAVGAKESNTHGY